MMPTRIDAVPAAIVGCVMMLLAAHAWCEDSPDQRLMEALLAEGTLLQQEVLKLQPIGLELDQERKRLLAEEKQLTDDAAQVTKSFEQFNAAADQLNVETQQQREDCAAGSSKLESEVESCNSRSEALRTQANALSGQGAELDKRQQDVNQRIVQHNAAGREWNTRSRAHQQRWMPEIEQVRSWLGRFKDFVDSESFGQFALSAGDPPGCAQERIGALNPLDSLPSLARALQCLKALKAGIR